jgi:hypothetical protein
MSPRELVDCIVMFSRTEDPIARFTTDLDLDDVDQLRRLLIDAVTGAGYPEDRVGEFVMTTRDQQTGDELRAPFRTTGY